MTDNAAEIARQLTTGEIKLLKSVEGSQYTETSIKLIGMGLLSTNNANFGYPIGWKAVQYLTELGNAVLAALQPATEPAQAGGPGKLGVSPTDVIETMDRNGLLNYIKDMRLVLENVADDTEARRSALLAENEALQTRLQSAESRLRQAEAERDATVAKVKRLSRKSDLDEGFIDFLTAKGDEL